MTHLTDFHLCLFFQRHGYCTLGEAFNRLDFFSAVQDARRFTYVARVSILFQRHLMTLWSGCVLKIIM